MKILYICSDVEIPVCGSEGSSLHIRGFTNALAAAGHKVDIFGSWLDGAPPADLVSPVHGIEPHGMDAAAWAALEQDPFVGAHNLDRDLKSIMVNTWLQKRMEAYAQGGRPDFIYERYGLFGWSGLELARRWNVPLILEVNAPIAQEQEGYERFVLMQMADRVEKEILCGAGAVIAVSGVVGDWALSRGVARERLHVIPNAISKARFERPGDGVRVRERFGLAGSRIIGFVGSFQPWQDTACLVRAFERVRPRHPGIHLLLVGYGPLRDELSQYVAGRKLEGCVTFAGSAPHAEIPDYLAAMDVVVAPYPRWKGSFHGSPMKLFEYMASGRPIVAAALGQIGEILEHGRTGLLYEPGDEEGLAGMMERMLADPAAAATMARAARVKALRDHSWDAVASRVLKMVEEIRPR
jgi:glycosyltransferase involved in cell wall biosynthesis